MVKMMEVIKQVVEALPAIAVPAGIVFIIGMIFLILGGGFEEQATLGNLPVPNSTVTALTTLNTGLSSAITTVTDQVNTAVNYTPLVVIALIGVGIIAGLVFLFAKGRKKTGNL